MSVVLKIIGLTNGEVSPFDGEYVAAYDPTYVHPEGYDGGILEVCQERDEALQFPDAMAALECWKQSYGMREDGKPNRPLTAFSVEVS